jgi:xylulokinase
LARCGVALDGAAVVVGGGARSVATLQLLADLLGDEVLVLDAEEATARGACVQAAAVAAGADVAGLIDLAKSWQPDVRQRVSPRTHRRDLAALRGRWAELAASTVFDSGVPA